MSRVLLIAPVAVQEAGAWTALTPASGAQIERIVLSDAETALSASAFDEVIAVLAQSDLPRFNSLLVSIAKSLTRGGHVKELVHSPIEATTDASTQQLELTLAGFVDVTASACPSLIPGTVAIEVSAVKPAWETGSGALLRRKKASPVVSAPTATNEGRFGGMMSSLSVQNNAGSDLIDEDALLAVDDAVPVASAISDSGCATKRRACANCSCGRAEAEEAASRVPNLESTAAPIPATAPFKSQCGNCYKGDAFRCASCPMLGKPAFIPGTDGAVMLDTGASDF